MATIYGRRLSVGNGVSPNPPENWQQLIYIDESETWSAPKDGWYRFHVVGKCGDGAAGGSRHTVNMKPTGDGYGGGGGGSGGWAIHVLKMKEGDTIEITINNSLTSLGEYCYATAGQNASGRTGGQGGEAEGGNIMNLIGGVGGDGGNDGEYPETTRILPEDGGLNGAKAGTNYGTGINFGGGGGGGGAGYNRNEKPNVAYIGDITQYAGGNGGYYDTSGTRVTPTGGGIYPNPTPEDDPNTLIALYGGGNGGGGFFNLNAPTLPVGQGSAGSPGCVIIEVEAEK